MHSQLSFTEASPEARASETMASLFKCLFFFFFLPRLAQHFLEPLKAERLWAIVLETLGGRLGCLACRKYVYGAVSDHLVDAGFHAGDPLYRSPRRNEAGQSMVALAH